MEVRVREVRVLKKSEYLRTLYGKALKNLVWVERQLSSSGILSD